MPSPSLTPQLFVERFLKESEARQERVNQGISEWSEHAWDVLHAMRAHCDLYCACARGDHPVDRGEKREWMWDLTWFAPGVTKQFVQPLTIIEHENSHADDSFLNDFWKVMMAVAPLRVMIGYTGSGAELLDRRKQRIAAAIEGWTFPSGTTDLVFVKRFGGPWDVQVRAVGENRFRAYPAD